MKVCAIGGLISLVLFGASGCRSSNPSQPLLVAPVSVEDALLEHSSLDRLLREHVDGDRVDYARLLRNRATLDAVLAGMARITPSQLADQSPAARMAFWINAYNAWTLRSILDHYPIESSLLRSLVYPENSIRQIDDVWQKRHPVASGRWSLEQIEHEILRPKHRDPRIHFAINCASVGCPPLRAEAYRGEVLEQQLEEQAREFLNDARRNRISPTQNVVEVSRIFEWFGADFRDDASFTADGPAPKAVLRRIAEWVDEGSRDFVRSFPPDQVEYRAYDWELNDTRRGG